MRLLPVLGLFLLLSASCGNRKPPSPKTGAPVVLTETEIFREGTVRAFLDAHPTPDRQANDLFMQAIDRYRNGKDVAGALQLFTRSLLQHPTAKAYYEYGNASMDAGKYEAAVKAFQMSELLGFEPVSRLLYNEACAWSRLGKEEEAIRYLEYAVEAGYTNAEHILKDPDLATARGSGYFQAIYQDAMAGNQDANVVSWLAFRRGFPQAELPLTLNAATEKTIPGEAYISYDFEKFVPEMKGLAFSRDVGKEFFYLARVAESAGYTAVVYAVRNTMMGESAPYVYILASFNGRGKLIDKLIAGGQAEPGDPFRVAVIQPSLQIEVKDFKQEYEKDPKEQGYADNKVISSELTGTRRYRITEEGHFAPDDRMIGMR